MCCTPFLKQIDEKSRVLSIGKSRDGLAVHNLIFDVAFFAQNVNTIGGRTGVYNNVSHCSAPEK
jgi:hypothetical protein